MAALFADLPEAIDNTVEIARRCAFAPERRDPILPKFADDEVEELRRQAEAGLKGAACCHSPRRIVEEYEKRLDFELGSSKGWAFPAIS